LGSNTKGKLFLACFRISAWFGRGRLRRIIGLPIRWAYRIGVQWILGIDIPDGTSIGFAPDVYHGHGLVVHELTVIGDRVRLHHNTTIGVARPGGNPPRIGNNVVIGANAVVIGAITLGDGAIVAAGSVVIRDVPPGSVVAGNPAKEVRKA
jgi:serine acetyltransferase